MKSQKGESSRSTSRCLYLQTNGLSQSPYSILMIVSYWLKGGYLTPSHELLYRMKFFCEEIAQLKSAGTLLDRAYDVQCIVALEVRIATIVVRC
jgi:hypothetical protein